MRHKAVDFNSDSLTNDKQRAHVRLDPDNFSISAEEVDIVTPEVSIHDT